jgi:ATPase subunit of ABC transporter with duplicated ATPase domains
MFPEYDIISIFGVIGIGKSTFIQQFRNQGYIVLEEDTQKWGKSLELAYLSRKKE